MDGFVTKSGTTARPVGAIAAATQGVAGAVMADATPTPEAVQSVPVPQPAAAPQLAPPPPATEAPLPPVLDAVFLATLADDIGTDGALEALGLFREDGPARILLMRDCLGRDPARLRREAHALAGAARNIGLVRLGQAASALQRAVERAEPEPAQVETLAALVDDSLVALAAWERTAVKLA